MGKPIIQTKIIGWVTVLLAMLLLTTGCGGSGGGGGGVGTVTEPVDPTPVAIGTFIKTTDLVVDNEDSLTFGAQPEAIFQQLYLASEINGSGFITGISFLFTADVVDTETCPNVTIRLGHISLNELTDTYLNNVELGQGAMQTVVDDETVAIPPGSMGEYFHISFDTPFHYNGMDNLVLEFIRSSPCTAYVEIEINNTTGANREVGGTTIDATGSLGPSIRLTKFHFEGGDNALDFGGINDNVFPFGAFADGTTRTQFLYLAEEIDGSGPVTGLGFQVAGDTVEAHYYTATIQLAHTSQEMFSSVVWDENHDGVVQTVADEVTVCVPAGLRAGDFFWVPIPDGVFEYDGTRNLLVDVDVSSGTGITAIRTEELPNRRLSGRHDDGDSASFGVDDVCPHVQLRFNGGTMDVLTGGTNSDLIPFRGSEGRRQYLYLAGELGSRGTIDTIALRNWRHDGSADTGFQYTVRIGHTSAATLATDFAANGLNPVTVFSGTLDIPEVVGGEWYQIPLSTPFEYNGEDNLVVEIGGTGGSATTTGGCRLQGDATRYAGRRLHASGAADAAGNSSNMLMTMRFWLERY